MVATASDADAVSHAWPVTTFVKCSKRDSRPRSIWNVALIEGLATIHVFAASSRAM